MIDTKRKLADLVLRKLGHPVIKINISDDQLNDAINDGIKLYNEYSSEANESILIDVELTQNLIDKKQIFLPNNVFAIEKIFTNSSIFGQNRDPLSLGSQIKIPMVQSYYNYYDNDNIGNKDLTMSCYYINMMNINMMEKQLGWITQYKFNRNTKKLSLFEDFSNYAPGDKIGFIVKSSLILPSDNLTDSIANPAYGDNSLTKLCIGYAKQIWSDNLSKFGGIKMPGGIEFNHVDIKQDATRLLEEAKEELMGNYSDSMVPIIA
jgi:hypothetical protein